MLSEREVLAALLKDVGPRDRKTRKFIGKHWNKFARLPDVLHWTSEERAFWIDHYMADDKLLDAEIACREKQAGTSGESRAEPEEEGRSSFSQTGCRSLGYHQGRSSGSQSGRRPLGYHPASYVARPLRRLLDREERESDKNEPAETALEAWQRQVRSVLPESVEEVIETLRPRTNVVTALRILLQFLLEGSPMLKPERAVMNNGKPNYLYLCKQINAYARSDRRIARAYDLGPRKKKNLITDKPLKKWLRELAIVLRRNDEKQLPSSEGNQLPRRNQEVRNDQAD